MQCANSSKPLLTAVDSLVTYANSPEFARVPAKISAEVNSPFSIYIRVCELSRSLCCFAARESIYCLRLSRLACISLVCILVSSICTPTRLRRHWLLDVFVSTYNYADHINLGQLDEARIIVPPPFLAAENFSF